MKPADPPELSCIADYISSPMGLPDWADEIKAQARAMWREGIPRAEIVAKLQPAAAALGMKISVHTLNGFALRNAWGPHPLSPNSGQRSRFARPKTLLEGPSQNCLGCGVAIPTDKHYRLCTRCRAAA